MQRETYYKIFDINEMLNRLAIRIYDNYGSIRKEKNTMDIIQNLGFESPITKYVTKNAKALYDKYKDGIATFIVLTTSLMNAAVNFIAQGYDQKELLDALEETRKDTLAAIGLLKTYYGGGGSELYICQILESKRQSLSTKKFIADKKIMDQIHLRDIFIVKFYYDILKSVKQLFTLMVTNAGGVTTLIEKEIGQKRNLPSELFGKQYKYRRGLRDKGLDDTTVEREVLHWNEINHVDPPNIWGYDITKKAVQKMDHLVENKELKIASFQLAFNIVKEIIREPDKYYSMGFIDQATIKDIDSLLMEYANWEQKSDKKA